MIELITKTPVFVWPLLVFLLFMGIRARKLSTVPLKLFVIMPTIFCTWAIYAILMRYGINFVPLFLWTISMLIGVWIGYLIVSRFSMRFDKINKKGRSSRELYDSRPIDVHFRSQIFSGNDHGDPTRSSTKLAAFNPRTFGYIAYRDVCW